MNRIELHGAITDALATVKELMIMTNADAIAVAQCLIAKAQLNALQDIATALEKIAEQQSDSDAEEPAQ